MLLPPPSAGGEAYLNYSVLVKLSIANFFIVYYTFIIGIRYYIMDVVLIDLSDEELVSLFKNGNEKAFDELYYRYSSRIKKLIFYNLGNSSETNDVSQEVFLRVYRHIDTFNPSRPFSSWIYKIAVNCSKNYKQRNVRNEILFVRKKYEIQEGEGEISPEELFIKNSDLSEFYSAIENLKEKFRTVFLLRFDHGMRYSKISEIVQCSERTAKWRMQKAIEKIVDFLRDRDVV